MATIRGNAPTHVFIDDVPVSVKGVTVYSEVSRALPREQWCRFCGGRLQHPDVAMCCDGCTKVYLPTAWQVRTIYGFSRNLGKREHFQKMQQITDA